MKNKRNNSSLGLIEDIDESIGKVYGDSKAVQRVFDKIRQFCIENKIPEDI